MLKNNLYGMRKCTVFVMGLVWCSVSLTAQYKDATEEQKKEIVSKIMQVSDEMNTMQCDFTQVKELSFMDEKITSEGKMAFKKPNKIRWEYTKPYRYIFSMDGQNVRMTTGDNTNKMPANQSKMFNAISKVMIGGVSGSGLVDSPDFDAQFMVGNNDYKVVLIPRQKEVKDLFSSIQIFADKTESRINKVELIDKEGDKTTITLRNLQINSSINDALFMQ